MSEKSEKRIMIYVSNWLGTSETFIFNQLGAFSGSLCPVIVAANKNDNDNILNSSSFYLHFLPIDKFHFLNGIIKRKLHIPGNRYKASRTQQKKIYKVINSNKVELIHAHYGTMGLNILPAAKKMELPLITTFHGNDASKMLKKRAYRKSLKYLFDYENSYIIAVSNKMKDRLIELGAKKERIQSHYIGTDLSRFKFEERVDVRQKLLTKEKIIFLQISNFVEKKGHLDTIKAFKIVSLKFPNLLLKLGGDGQTRNECEDLVKSLELEDQVQFLGRVNPNKVYGLMKTADYFIHNSVTGDDGSEEGIPTVIMEAMATGLPVLTTCHAGIPELVIDEKTGFLSREKNIQDYVTNFEKALHIDSREIGRRAYEHVKKNFNLNLQNKKLRGVYDNFLGKSSKV